jgi:cation:H+ antiporter
LRSTAAPFVVISLGFAALVAGGESLLRGAVGIPTLLRLTPAVIALTVVAAGTSVSELAVSTMAAFRGSTEITVGNVIGSKFFNLLFVSWGCAPSSDRSSSAAT